MAKEPDPMTIEINGMAHVILTVSRFEVAREFYRRLLPECGMKVVADNDRFFYCIGARGLRLAFNHAIRRWLASASSSSGLACTICACEPDRVRTWTNAPLCSARWARSSFAAPPKTHGRRATTPCCSRTRTASG
jgi:catechol-2,3-dioxygenase